MLFLAQALSGLSHPIRMTLITSGVHSVRGDAQLMPERALLHGAWRVIPRELGHVDGMAIDIDLPAPSSVGEVVLVDRLAREIRGQADDDVVAYRDGQRWVRRFEAVALAPAGVSPWRSDGVYLITGGLGGIGLSIAEHIATVAPGATLVLLGRTPMPPAHQWPALLATPTIDPALARRLAAVQRMQRSGCSVMLPAADVTDIAAITAVVADVQRSHGRITGVIHSAGILRDALIALRTPTIVSPVVDVKARGLLVVDQVLAKHPPELLVLCSSVSSIIGLPGQFDYTAANAFLDSFAAAKNEEGHTRAVVVNWNAWQEVGMAVDAIKVAVARTDTVEPTTESSVHLFDSVTDDGTTSVRTSRMSRRRNWLLAEHAVHGGDALMPGTGFVEILRSAATADDPGNGPVELRDLFFLSPFTVLPGEVRTLQVKHDRTTSSLVVFSETETMPHVTATALPAEGTAQPRVDLDAVRSRCHDRFEEFDGYSNQP
ncbi:MAG: SDR family oxidoreductase, partial [Ilumatobacteraceae bacterium]